MTVRTLHHNAGGFVLKKKLCLFIFLQMTVLLFYAQAKKQNHVRQKKEVTMKEKIICIPAEWKEKGDLRNYHYFQLCVSDDDMLQLNFSEGPMEYIEKYLKFSSRLRFPMERVPEVVKTMTDAFYLGNPLEGRWGYTIALPDSKFRAGLSFDERSWVMDEYSLIQDDNDKIWEHIRLEWDMETMSKVPLKGTRVMPKSLAALIEGLRDFYNEWQKAHPEFERIE